MSCQGSGWQQGDAGGLDEPVAGRQGDAAASETCLRRTQHRWEGVTSERVAGARGLAGGRILRPQCVNLAVASHRPPGVFKRLTVILSSSFQAVPDFLPLELTRIQHPLDVKICLLGWWALGLGRRRCCGSASAPNPPS